jgi:autotransporter translocation and assembly factor TamB
VAMAGAFSLRDGRVVIGALGQELSDVQARLSLDDNVLRIERLTARDFDGRVSIDGQVTFAGARELRTELELALTDFPIRRESAQV